MKTISVPHHPVTLERLERGLATAAHLLMLHGPALVPIFERPEREIASMRSNHDAISRAKRLLESSGVPDGLKALHEKH